jgi:hypothetical protein
MPIRAVHVDIGSHTSAKDHSWHSVQIFAFHQPLVAGGSREYIKSSGM